MEWFIYRCRSNWEFRAQAELQSLQMTTLLPVEKVFIKGKQHKRPQAKLLPIWDGYICAGGSSINWPELCRLFSDPSKALSGPLKMDGVAHPIGPSLVNEIRSRSWIQLAPFKMGDRVRVHEGPFGGHLGTLVELTDSKAQIIIDMLGKSVPAEFNPATLEKVE